MTAFGQTRFLLALALGLLLHTSPASAGPSVIRDEMVQDTAITPALGRGYSIATNTYQSICLTGVASTEPSYTFDYAFKTVDAEKADAAVSEASALKMPGAEPKVESQMLATIKVEADYASVDEAKSKMSPAATKMLKQNDVPGFFDSCGMYYVRSISRRAAVFAVFTYTRTTAERDQVFETQLKASLERPETLSKAETRVFTKEAKLRNLTITARTDGEPDGAKRLVELAAFHKQLRATVHTEGAPSHIEVVPWIENAEFQARSKLETVEIVDPSCAGTEGCPLVKRTATDQKRYLTVNAEFLAELERALRGHGLDDRHEAHLYGGAERPADGVDDDVQAAFTCIDQLFTGKRLQTASYRTIESCRRAERVIYSPAPAATAKATRVDGPAPARPRAIGEAPR